MRGRLSQLWSDLKRRRIFSVGAFYAVAAWVLVQVCALVFPTFGAPAWLLRAVVVAAFAGFPVALVLTWVFDIGPAGVEVTDDADGTVQSGPRGARRWIRPLIAAPLLALIVGGTVWLWSSGLATTGDTEFTRQMRPDELPVVAVLPLENLTGRKELAWAGAGLSTLVRDDLAQSRYLAVVSAARTARLGAVGDLQALLTAAAEAGITHVMTGEILRTPKGLTITSRLTDLRRNVEAASNRRERVEPDELLEQATAISAALKQGLGLPGTEKVDVFAADFASKNMAAYEAFIAGMQNFLNFDYASAKGAFEVAVKKAPEFAMARYRLAHTLAALGDTDGATIQIEQAKRDAARLSERERSYISAGGHYFKREFPAAERGYRELLEKHPYESEARLLLMYSLQLMERYEDAMIEAETLAAQDPSDEVAWSAMAEYNLTLQRYDGAGEALEKLLAITPSNPNAHHLLGDSYYFQQQFDQAARYYARALQLDPGFGDSTLRLAHIDILRNRPGQAIARLRLMLAAPRFSPSLRITSGFELAALLRARGDCAGADRALDQVHVEIAAETVRLPLELAARARCRLDQGDATGARQLAVDAVAKSPGTTPRYLLVRGLAELAAGDVSAVDSTIAAIRALATAPDRREQKAADYLLGMRDLKLGKAQTAVTALRRAVQGEGVEYDIYAVALARALAAAGDQREARSHARVAAALPKPTVFLMELEPSRYEAAKLLRQWGG